MSGNDRQQTSDEWDAMMETKPLPLQKKYVWTPDGMDEHPNGMYMLHDTHFRDEVVTLHTQLTIQAQRLAKAETALKHAGYTLKEGAEAWKPPLGPSVSPLLKKLDQQAKELERVKGELGDLKLRLNCPMRAPSCLVCGQVKPFVIAHLEASSIGVCEECRSASQQLAAMTTRFNETVKSFHEAIAREVLALQQLATAEATVKDLERRLCIEKILKHSHYGLRRPMTPEPSQTCLPRLAQILQRLHAIEREKIQLERELRDLKLTESKTLLTES